VEDEASVGRAVDAPSDVDRRRICRGSTRTIFLAGTCASMALRKRNELLGHGAALHRPMTLPSRTSRAANSVLALMPTASAIIEIGAVQWLASTNGSVRVSGDDPRGYIRPERRDARYRAGCHRNSPV
jgi:hypothetical protein